MIHEVKMYAATCDNCGESFSDSHNGYSAMNDQSGIFELMDNDGWHCEDMPDLEPNKHYCPQCFTINDNDELVINTTRTKHELSKQ